MLEPGPRVAVRPVLEAITCKSQPRRTESVHRSQSQFVSLARDEWYGLEKKAKRVRDDPKLMLYSVELGMMRNRRRGIRWDKMGYACVERPGRGFISSRQVDEGFTAACRGARVA